MIKFTGGKKLARQLTRIATNIKSKRPVRIGSEIIKSSIRNEAPVLTGELKNSVDIFEEPKRTLIGPTAEHAIFVVKGSRSKSPNDFVTKGYRKSKRGAVGAIEKEYKKLINQ